MSDLFAPEGGFVVRILDLSGASADNIVEEVKGFPTMMHANAFARAYVRDSVERCRVPGTASREVLASWFAYGEDAEVVDAGEQGWKSANELDDFVAHPASEIERDWRTLDPRLEEPVDPDAVLEDLDDDEEVEEPDEDERGGHAS
ncbi:hypothetical protein [Lichenicoccus roseus]|uniref:Uncharacterized protein n=1 Tax=Lichenicoccus roseus TaxID=2683649 RepID=A0A5R9JC45_9PROT|nr:hypothetical protein [Lichenicoccus roseus]TLU74333.1 hypothetical protein FE263_03855 [Lichenicoccus roseus]